MTTLLEQCRAAFPHLTWQGSARKCVVAMSEDVTLEAATNMAQTFTVTLYVRRVAVVSVHEATVAAAAAAYGEALAAAATTVQPQRRRRAARG